MSQAIFSPTGGTQKITLSSSSQRRELVGLDSVCGAVRLKADSGAPFIKFGDSSVVASLSDMPLTSGVTVLKVPPGATHIAAIFGSGDLVITVGHA